ITQGMERPNPPQPGPGEMEPIFVASSDINYNEEISPEKVRLEEWPKGKIQAGALTKVEDVIGKRSATRIFAGEPILAGKLMGGDGTSGAACKIPKGYRE